MVLKWNSLAGTVKSNFYLILMLTLVTILAIVVTYKLLGGSIPGTGSTKVPTIVREEAIDREMLPVCESHPLIKQYLSLNPGGTIKVGHDPGTYDSVYTCIVTSPNGYEVLFPFVRVK